VMTIIEPSAVSSTLALCSGRSPRAAPDAKLE
jgi:hypothetical protein